MGQGTCTRKDTVPSTLTYAYPRSPSKPCNTSVHTRRGLAAGSPSARLFYLQMNTYLKTKRKWLQAVFATGIMTCSFKYHYISVAESRQY